MEAEHKKRIIILGGAGDTGSEITGEFAKNGYQTIVWLTRNKRDGLTAEERFENLCRSIADGGGIPPTGCYADITKREEVDEAFVSMNLRFGEKVHFVQLAAAGFGPIKRPVEKLLIPLLRAQKNELLTPEMLAETTKSVKDIVTAEKSMESAMAVNVHAPLAVLDLLDAGNHLGENSVVADFSSMVADYTDPDNQDEYPGPWCYWVMGATKMIFTKAAQERVVKGKFRFINFVATMIEGTEAGEFGDRLTNLIKSAVPDIKPISRLTKTEAAKGLVAEFLEQPGSLHRISKVYLGPQGERTASRPSDWLIPVLPHL